MTLVSSGIFYSSQEFVEFVSDTPVLPDDFLSQKNRFGVSTPSQVFNASMKYGWVVVSEDGLIVPTDRGHQIISASSVEHRLREQIWDVIVTDQPIWAEKSKFGRDECVRFCDADAEQIFREAGLLDSWDENLIRWWDELGSHIRRDNALKRLETGRAAERETVCYEQDRTGKYPKWVGLDSSFFGFDVLSIVSSGNDNVLRIEVKGSQRRTKEADFVLSRNEWNTASATDEYCFHLWGLHGGKRLFVVTTDSLRPHIPSDNGSGRWETVRVAYKPFLACEVELVKEKMNKNI